MKRFTSILLVLVMLLTCGISVSANMTEEQFVDFMAAMDFIDSEGYESRELVSRSQFVNFIAKVIGAYSEDSAANFNALYTMGAINRENNGAFRENDNITYAEAAQAMLVIAGYGEAAYYNGGYSAYAAKYGIHCGKAGTDALTWNNVMELLYKTLNLYRMEGTYGEEAKYKIDTDRLVMSELFDIESSRGILSACGSCDLYSAKKSEKDRIVVNGVEYVGDAAAYREYVGYKVSVLYRQKADEREVVFLYPENRNDVVVLKDEDILEYKNREYICDENGRDEYYSLSDEVVFLYNGKLPTDASFELVPVNGWVELIDNNGDGDYDVVKICSYKNYYIELTSEDHDGLRIQSKTQAPVLVIKDSKTKDDTVILQEDGSGLKLKGLKKGGLVSVFGTEENGVLEAERVYYTTKTAEGVVGEYDPEEQTVTVGGTVYSFNADLKDTMAKISVGAYRSFIVDFNGKIAYVCNETGREYNQGVGYLIATDKSNGVFEDCMDLKIFNSAGRMEIYSSTDKLYLDGVLYKGSKDVMTALDGIDTQKLVAYTLNNDGTLRSLDFPKDKTYGDMSAQNPLDHMVSLGGSASNVKYRTSHNIFGGNIPCHDDTIMFILPSDPTSAEEEDFSISTPKTYCRDDGTFANIYGYAYSNSSMCADFIVYTAPNNKSTSLTVNDYDFAYAIKSVKKILNDNGEAVTAVEAIGPNGTETFEMKDASVLTGYEVGDVVRFATDIRGKAVKVQSVYDRSAKTFDSTLNSTSINCAFRALTGQVYDRDGDIISITEEDVASTTLKYNNFNVLQCNAAKIVLVKKDSGGKVMVKSVKSDEIKAYTTHGKENCSTVVATTRVGVCNLVVIFE